MNSCYNAVENVTQFVHEAGNLKFSTNLAVGPWYFMLW